MMDAANNNAARPAEFDARLMAYRPGMLRRAAGLTSNREDRDDLVTDTILKCLENWRNYRHEGGSFWNWIYWTMRGLVSHRHAAMARRIHIVEDPHGYFASTMLEPSSQVERLELVETLQAIPETREGDFLIKQALGHSLEEIGQDNGITRERVRQLVERERKQLASLRKAA